MQQSHLQFEQKLRTAFEKVKTILPLNQDWKESDKDSKLGLINHTKDDKDVKLPITRGEGLLNIPSDKLLNCIQDMNQQKQMEKKIKQASILQKTSSGYDIVFSVSETPIGDDREILSIQGTFQEGGSTYLVCTSIEDNNLQPVLKGHTRMEHHYLAYQITPQGAQSHVVYVSCADPKGMIPDFIKNKISKSRGIERLAQLAKFLA